MKNEMKIEINTGKKFEDVIFDFVKNKCKDNKNNIPYLHKKYFSVERQDYIIPDITIEKFINEQLFFVIVIECKDYKGSISVSEIEEFHSKLQQIGADNTKGILVTSNGKFQKSALNYAKSKGISLAVFKKDILFVDSNHYMGKSVSCINIIITFPLQIIKVLFVLLFHFMEYFCNERYLLKYNFGKIIDFYLNK